MERGDWGWVKKRGVHGEERLSRLRGRESKVELPVRTRSRGGFHGIIKMFVDVDGAGVVVGEGANEINVRTEAERGRDGKDTDVGRTHGENKCRELKRGWGLRIAGGNETEMRFVRNTSLELETA